MFLCLSHLSAFTPISGSGCFISKTILTLELQGLFLTPFCSHRLTLSILPIILSALYPCWELTKDLIRRKKITPDLEPTFPFRKSCPEFQSPVSYRLGKKVHKRESKSICKRQILPHPAMAGPSQPRTELLGRGKAAALSPSAQGLAQNSGFSGRHVSTATGTAAHRALGSRELVRLQLSHPRLRSLRLVKHLEGVLLQPLPAEFQRANDDSQ